MSRIFKGVTLPKGFQAAGGSAGIKKDHSDDIAMIYSTAPCVTAGTFTTNQVKAAPVLFDRALVYGSGISRAVLINSGIANACTGKEGMDCCRAEAEAVSECVGIPADTVLVASTGVIVSRFRWIRSGTAHRFLHRNCRSRRNPPTGLRARS